MIRRPAAFGNLSRGLALAIGIVAAGAALAEPEQCVDDELARLLSAAPELSRPAPPPKRDKRWIPSRQARQPGPERLVTTLWTVHLHEALPIYEGLVPPAPVLDRFFRCRGFAETRPLDPRLVDLVIAAATRFEARRVHVISAYRSEKLNDTLSKKGRQVAAESRHTRGEAIDFFLPGVPIDELARFVAERHDGGLGVYREDRFVHADVGPRRRWRGR